MTRCDSCKHWKKPGDRTDWRTAVSMPDYDVDALGDAAYDAAEALQERVDKQLGECSGVPANPAADRLPVPMAAVVDGSDYFARLYTGPDFHCALWVGA